MVIYVGLDIRPWKMYFWDKTISSYELSSATNFLMCGYKGPLHSTHLWIKFNSSTNHMTVKWETYRNQMVSAIILIPRFY